MASLPVPAVVGMARKGTALGAMACFKKPPSPPSPAMPQYSFTHFATSMAEPPPTAMIPSLPA